MGGSRASRRRGRTSADACGWWLAVGVFHFGGSEWVHCQPDGWMLAATLAALMLRLRRVQGAGGAPFCEGVCWAVACSIKPFPAVAAAAVAAMSWAIGGRDFRRTLGEELRVLAGGVAALAALGGWLAQSGNWPHYLESFRDPWWRSYYKHNDPPAVALRKLFEDGLPWSLVEPLGAVVGLHDVVRAGRRGAGTAGTTRPVGGGVPRVVGDGELSAGEVSLPLGAGAAAVPGGRVDFASNRGRRREAPLLLLLAAGAWSLALAFRPDSPRLPAVVRGGFDAMTTPIAAALSAPAPTVAGALGVGLTSIAGVMIGWRATTVVLLAGIMALTLAVHPLLAPQRLRAWPACWTGAENLALRTALTIRIEHGNEVDFVRLREVERFLRSQGVQDRDVDCFAVNALPLYTRMGLRPPHRYLIPTTLNLLVPDLAPKMNAEIRAARRRFIVDARGNSLADGYRQRFGYPDEPVVFRSGVYEVREVPRRAAEPPRGSAAP